MEQLFIGVLNNAITVSALIVAVVVVRAFGKKMPKWISCLLWMIVAVKLVVPIQFECVLSLIPSGKPIPANIVLEANPQISSGINGLDSFVNPMIRQNFAPDKSVSDVTFNGVDFGYTDEKMVLHDIVLHATPGQKIAFVGSTGAGKTTITNLINRFYDIQDGKIRYDNININKIKKADLRRSLGIVLQDTHLFTGTVKDNIRYGKLNATDEEVIAAAKLANAHSFIKRLPEGYDTMLTGDGANLSQGQRQLLAIARAAIADPPVLILDEATSEQLFVLKQQRSW